MTQEAPGHSTKNSAPGCWIYTEWMTTKMTAENSGTTRTTNFRHLLCSNHTCLGSRILSHSHIPTPSTHNCGMQAWWRTVASRNSLPGVEAPKQGKVINDVKFAAKILNIFRSFQIWLFESDPIWCNPCIFSYLATPQESAGKTTCDWFFSNLETIFKLVNCQQSSRMNKQNSLLWRCFAFTLCKKYQLFWNSWDMF